MFDYNSEKNQEIKKNFVNREVFCNASSMIYQLQQDGHYQDEIMEFSLKYELMKEDLIDDIKKDYKEEAKEYLKDREVKLEDLDEEELKELAEELNINIDNYEESVEAYEHWIVSDWLGGKLEDLRELVTLDFLGLTIWGRTCSGQAIFLDWVISKICKDLGLLEESKIEVIRDPDPYQVEKVFKGE
ncbi:hypothetical protein CVT91_00040 [Candidatus Atribacteria bacterium HGW-Atribacteria-1]|nr:MAG: hypothetical protein CVT91_00040 [Candidatus Atribacteria bacterium HGW-Atribacteria-1]